MTILGLLRRSRRETASRLPTIPESNVNEHFLEVYCVPTSLRKENKAHCVLENNVVTTVRIQSQVLVT